MPNDIHIAIYMWKLRSQIYLRPRIKCGFYWPIFLLNSHSLSEVLWTFLYRNVSKSDKERRKYGHNSTDAPKFARNVCVKVLLYKISHKKKIYK